MPSDEHELPGTAAAGTGPSDATPAPDAAHPGGAAPHPAGSEPNPAIPTYDPASPGYDPTNPGYAPEYGAARPSWTPGAPQAGGAPQPGGVPAPAAPGRRWSGRRTAVVVAVAVGLATAGGVAISAATSNASTTSTNGAVPQGRPGGDQYGVPPGQEQQGQPGQPGQGEPDQQGRPPGGAGRGLLGGGLAGALHGEFVVADGNGGYVTRLLQTGKVTAKDATSITVVSDDGYSKKYSIGSASTVGDEVAAGVTVTLVANQDGSVVSVSDRGALGGPPQRRQQGESPTSQPQPTT